MNITADSNAPQDGMRILNPHANASVETPEPHVEKMSRRARMLLLAGATSGLWGFIGGAAYLIVTKV